MKQHTKGHLYLRGKTWWLTYSTGRKDATGKYDKIFISTGEKQQDKAEDWAARHMAPMSLRNEADRAQAIAETVKTAEEKALDAARTAEAQRDRLVLADVWDKYPYEWTSPKRGTRRKLAPRNVEENRAAWHRFVRWCKQAHPEIEHTDQVTPDTAKEYSHYLIAVDKLTPGRHNKLLITAGVMLRLAGKPDPFAAVQRHEVKHESRANLELGELDKIISTATGELRRLFGVALYTGMRLSDCVLLKWSSLHHGKVFKTGKERTKKTGKELVFPVHPVLQAVLDEIPPQERGEYVLPELARKYIGDGNKGYMLGHQLISKMVREHFEKCGIACVEDRETGAVRKMADWKAQAEANRKSGGRKGIGVSRRGFHSFRHSFITECAKSGVPIGMIRDWVGHSSEKITEIYEHWSTNEGHQRIMDALPVFGKKALPAPATSVKALQKELRSLIPTGTAGKLAAAITALR